MFYCGNCILHPVLGYLPDLQEKGPVEFSRGEILLFYIATRIVPLFMLQTRSSRNLLCLSTEWMILGLLYFISAADGQRLHRKGRLRFICFSREFPALFFPAI